MLSGKEREREREKRREREPGTKDIATGNSGPNFARKGL